MTKHKKVNYPLEWQKDDFHIKIFCSIPNIATGILLTTKHAKFIIDPGDGILRDLNTELEPKSILEISDIFISHGHHDHIGGIWSLLTYLFVMKRKDDLNIYYPAGCKEIESIIKAFQEVYFKDLSYKIILHGISKQNIINREMISIEPYEVFHCELSNNEKTPVQVPALGYKFTYNENTICYGGDTAFCNNLVDMVKNSDLAIIEAGAENENDSQLHLTIEQAENIGRTAKEYFLVHLHE